jgi:flagellar motor switch protein FliM
VNKAEAAFVKATSTLAGARDRIAARGSAMNVKDDGCTSLAGSARVDFARRAAAAFRRLASSRLKIDVDALPMETTSISQQAFHDSLEDSSCVFVCASPGRGVEDLLICELSPSIAFVMIDLLLGGSAQALVPFRSLTKLERELLGKLLDRFTHELGQSAPGMGAFTCDSRSQWKPALGGGDFAVARLAITIGNHAGAMRLGLSQGLHSLAMPADGARPGAGSPVELSVVVEDGDAGEQDLEQLQAGDIIVTASPANGEVVVRLAGIPKYYGKLVSSNGKRAIRITRPIDEPERGSRP